MPKINIKAIRRKELKPLHDDWLVRAKIVPESELSESSASRTHHLGALHRGAIVGIASLYNEPRPAMIEGRAWRLRGLAVAPNVRREGYGGALIEAAVRHLLRSKGELLWANVTADSCDFFRAMKFEVAGDAFDLQDFGPHFRVLLRPKKR